MPRTIETTVYTYDELTPAAQAKARDAWRELEQRSGDNSFADHVIDDAIEVGQILGITFKTHEVRLHSGKTRRDPSIWWSLGYCQSDGAAFDGTYQHKRGSVKKLRAYAPTDTVLHAIVDDLAAAQKLYGYKAYAEIKSEGGRGCTASVIVTDETGDRTPPDRVVQPIDDCLRRFRNWIYTQLRDAYEWHMADEQVAETLQANDYEFTAAGRFHR